MVLRMLLSAAWIVLCVFLFLVLVGALARIYQEATALGWIRKPASSSAGSHAKRGMSRLVKRHSSAVSPRHVGGSNGSFFASPSNGVRGHRSYSGASGHNDSFTTNGYSRRDFASSVNEEDDGSIASEEPELDSHDEAEEGSNVSPTSGKQLRRLTKRAYSSSGAAFFQQGPVSKELTPPPFLKANERLAISSSNLLAGPLTSNMMPLPEQQQRQTAARNRSDQVSKTSTESAPPTLVSRSTSVMADLKKNWSAVQSRQVSAPTASLHRPALHADKAGEGSEDALDSPLSGMVDTKVSASSVSSGEGSARAKAELPRGGPRSRAARGLGLLLAAPPLLGCLVVLLARWCGRFANASIVCTVVPANAPQMAYEVVKETSWLVFDVAQRDWFPVVDLVLRAGVRAARAVGAAAWREGARWVESAAAPSEEALQPARDWSTLALPLAGLILLGGAGMAREGSRRRREARPAPAAELERGASLQSSASESAAPTPDRLLEEEEVLFDVADFLTGGMYLACSAGHHTQHGLHACDKEDASSLLECCTWLSALPASREGFPRHVAVYGLERSSALVVLLTPRSPHASVSSEWERRACAEVRLAVELNLPIVYVEFQRSLASRYSLLRQTLAEAKEAVAERFVLGQDADAEKVFSALRAVHEASPKRSQCLWKWFITHDSESAVSRSRRRHRRGRRDPAVQLARLLAGLMDLTADPLVRDLVLRAREDRALSGAQAEELLRRAAMGGESLDEDDATESEEGERWEEEEEEPL